ncbi:hypothetical protein D3C73_1088020 [compost metagenome]|uniref:hypothetical protein n=1 Tax=Brevundimonas diminuta TaxID=293 RepID=UPI000FAA949D|nr:hypothetical protein [Brevundimonas diminuta]
MSYKDGTSKDKYYLVRVEGSTRFNIEQLQGASGAQTSLSPAASQWCYAYCSPAAVHGDHGTMDHRRLTAAEKRLVIAAAFGGVIALAVIIWAVLTIISGGAD